VFAHRTNLGRLEAFMNVSTIAALPIDFPIANKDRIVFNVGQELEIAFLMLFFDLANRLKQIGNLIKAFFLGGLCKARIHISPFVIFARRGIL
jgi:hypothetical protein